jgi:sugar phosphate isomerase/epimerase
MIGDMDKRVGLCLDIGHQFRDGKDPVKAILVFHERHPRHAH